MKSRVYFIAVRNSDDKEVVKLKLAHLLEKSGLLGFAAEKDRVALKLHFGEEGNTGFVSPEYVRIISDKILQRGATPFLIDTNTLYRGRRTNPADHLNLAQEHGFTKDNCNAEIIIPDENKKENTTEVFINQKHIKTAKIVTPIVHCNGIVGIAHFKGHLMTGFGGALKNIGMGCAAREGKLAQHSDISPFVILEKCIGCGKCEAVCPVKAIYLKGKKSFIITAKCIGCASCIAVCKNNAIDVDWESGSHDIQEKMIEYAFAVLKNKKTKAIFINFAIKITKECDCLAKDDPRIVPDIGILASDDPVAIDKACLDLVNETAGKNVFKEIHPQRDCFKQLSHAFKLGLGNLDYDLKVLSLTPA